MASSDWIPDGTVRSAPVPLDACGMAGAAFVLGDKWTMLVLRELFYGVRRFEDIRADIGVSKSVLTDRLQRLVNHGVLETEPYREAGARTRKAYRLTPAGRELLVPVLALKAWGEKHLEGREVPWGLVDERGVDVEIGLVTEDGRGVSLEETTIRLGPPKAR
jgi:DNA-binding HxlR family transcriptional regulator